MLRLVALAPYDEMDEVLTMAQQTYPDFLNSTPIKDDGPALRQRLDRDGYLFIRGVLPRQTILGVRQRLLEKAAAGGWLDPASPIEAGIANPAAACKDPEERYMRVFGICGPTRSCIGCARIRA